MKNPAKKGKWEQRGPKYESVCVTVLSGLFFACIALFVFGCNDSLEAVSDYPTTYDNLSTVHAVELLSKATEIVNEGLADQDPRIRANAIEVVASTRCVELMPKVQRLLGDRSVPVRFAAALTIADLEYSLARSEVAKLQNDVDRNVRIGAAYAMGRLASFENTELLRRALASREQSVRANAALLLGKKGDKGALKFLYWVLRDRDSEDKVRFNAVEAIARLGDERIYPKIWAMLISAYHDDRVFGIGAMGALGTVRAKESLITMLDDDVLEVRLAAAEQLGMLGDPAGQGTVTEVFKKNLRSGLTGEDLERVNLRTALAIGRIASASLAKFLPGLLRNESKLVRLAAAKAVFQSAVKK